MNRIFFIVAAASAVVLSFAVSFAAESGNASTQKTDKDLYRTQHKGGFVMPKPIIAPQESVDVDKTPLPAQTVSPAQAVSQNVYYGKNRQVPAPPVVPFRTEQPVVVLQDAPMLSPMNRSGVVVLDRKAGEMPLEQRFAEETVLQPLSGIDLPKNTDTPASFTSPTFAPEVKKIDGVSPAPPAITPVPPTVAIPAAVITPHSNLDELNSRLAKIQLEKKNLPAVLSLVDKIKSPEFKVKTLVNLAEYVSRDS
ncbi:MAG: hypothetical protein FWE67_11265, partial [Planctomycetaceae bacterium]|nr:hypothetical protein [Planctomycetaceae bacterium]